MQSGAGAKVACFRKNEIEATKVFREPSPGTPNRQEALMNKIFLLTTAVFAGFGHSRWDCR